MGFMERFKAKGRGNGGVATAELSPFDEMVLPHGGGAADRAGSHASTVSLDMHASQATRQISSSIISEAAPSELAPDFNESRPQPRCSGGRDVVAADRQQDRARNSSASSAASCCSACSAWCSAPCWR